MAKASAGLHRLRQELTKLPAEIVVGTGDVIRTALLDEARVATGGDLRLSGVSWMRFTLDVSVTVNKAGNDSSALLAPAPAFGGPSIWSWIEFGTRGHDIGTGSSRRWPTRRQRLRIGGNWVTGPVTVRGMRAKRAWSRGVEAGFTNAIKEAERLFEKAVA